MQEDNVGKSIFTNKLDIVSHPKDLSEFKRIIVDLLGTTVRTILNRQRWNAGFSIITEANTNGGMRVSASASKNVRSIVGNNVIVDLNYFLKREENAAFDYKKVSKNNSPDNFKSPTVECGFQHHH